ncbi:hypothetical protein DFH27DRAFT_487513 [Peziza echinospora]|nr:hypothetical protein DFH27DRAFT_487513 [Peziza echinospora]
MTFLFIVSLVYIFTFANGFTVKPAPAQKPVYRATSCPDYKSYSARPHPPYTSGKYKLPFQRPAEECRLFRSSAVEKVIDKMVKKLKDEDLARLFENGFPNTLDTTIRWHVPGGTGEQPETFIVTGDINAQWLRDSTNQLSQYQHLAKHDATLKTLILGAINTQADFVLASPYCNAFQPPPQSGLHPTNNGQDDIVHPIYDPTLVFECKYEIDSLASFLSLANQYYENTKDASFATGKWIEAVKNVLVVIEQQQVSTFDDAGKIQDMTYTFSRNTRAGTETLNLGGIGNPLNANTSLIRSAFRPSDDATIMQFFIPGNAFMAVELKRAQAVLNAAGYSDLGTLVAKKAQLITEGIYKYGVINHAVFGKVFAYEVDGYGSHVIMDDANIPSLLSLPLLGFVKHDDPIYVNTRKMVLSQAGNPYFLRGPSFSGIGGPHIGIQNAWPMSLLVQIMTTDDDEEILGLLEMVLQASRLGLVNESVDVGNLAMYTRSWFAWANSVYAQTILDLEKRKPHLIF